MNFEILQLWDLPMAELTGFVRFLEFFMSSTVYAKGSDIYAAFIRGAERKYNRSTDDYKSYEAQLSESYDYLLNCVGNRDQIRAIKRKTKGSWRNAYLPLSLALKHHHIAGEPVEEHARVYLASDPFSVIDIPMPEWEKLEKSCPRKK